MKNSNKYICDYCFTEFDANDVVKMSKDWELDSTTLVRSCPYCLSNIEHILCYVTMNKIQGG